MDKKTKNDSRLYKMIRTKIINKLTFKMPITFILFIRDGDYVSQLVKKINYHTQAVSTSTSIGKCMLLMLDQNLITTIKTGRIRKMFLTVKGKAVQQMFLDMIILLKQNKNEKSYKNC